MLSTIFENISRYFLIKGLPIRKFILISLITIHLSLFTVSYGQTNMFDFYLPWDDSTPSITNLSFLNHKPAGKLGFVTVGSDGHFHVGEERIRFFGMNVTAAACFPLKQDAERVAKRLAKFGINIVRFHFLDKFWDFNIFASDTNTRDLSAEALGRFDYFFAKLKEQGIYSHIDLLVGRYFQPADGLPASINELSWKEKQVPAMFYRPLIELQKEYANRLLNRINPYTNIRLADDPAVAMIEILNEHGLIQGWLDGTIDKLPPEFSEDLRVQWNNWLTQKYNTHANLVASGWALFAPLGNELLINGNFSSGIQNWNFEQHSVAEATITVTNEGPAGSNSARISVTRAGELSWHIQLHQGGIPVSSARPYTLSFFAKADSNRPLEINLGMAEYPWSFLGFSRSLNLTPSWQEFTFKLFPSENFNNARVNFTNMMEVGTYWISQVSFRPGGDMDLYPGENLDNKTMRITTHANRGFRTAVAQRAWVRFLWELENNFWQEMYSYLRNVIGIRAPIAGTTVGLTSMPNIQKNLDFIDTHAYWHHPRFPGRPWDRDNWYVRNATLVNDPDGGTITDLAVRRVHGKPFTVTEYNHPAPNTFNAETFIFLGAYAAFQDWDGIFGYTFSHDYNWDERKMTGWFDMDQHPLQMVGLIPAVLMFRRGDVSPANNLVVARINKEDEIEHSLITSAWDLIDAVDVGMNRRTPFLHRTAILTENTPMPPGALTPAQVTIPVGNQFVSDTNELTWDTSAGIFTINTDRTKVVLGHTCNKEFNLGGIIIRPQPALQNWSCITISLIEGESFNNLPKGGRILITAMGASGNPDMDWRIYPDIPASFPPPMDVNIIIGSQWGSSPSFVEGISCKFVFPFNNAHIKVYSLDNRGHRVHRLPTTGHQFNTYFQISPSYQTVWYEIVYAPLGNEL